MELDNNPLQTNQNIHFSKIAISISQSPFKIAYSFVNQFNSKSYIDFNLTLFIEKTVYKKKLIFILTLSRDKINQYL